ncbi:UTP--glucose-1-phosphate uridylyltransferase [Capsulimonas corticalis]|uniref:UTP--glucose-1-phosphate uridylyltransferase n=1 Tax=Capsulimonas corticalis TaxID=2219043 RepID=A0A402CSH4_9BACT|nr:sugar phosphate nucleotidyltransferase [Capsulimonas corticalis]BDI31080.1 UTP--glucose-1-phosphate uridylyltransferase [Capsulimonas corticalis]
MATVKKAVVTAAGRGTRQYPATNTVQKELIPLVDVDGYTKPTLQIILEEVVASGIEEICVVANPTNLEPIQAHFQGLTDEQKRTQFAGKDWADALSDTLADIQSRLHFVVQHTQEGYGHAVYQAHEWAGDEPFVLMVGDHISLSSTSESCTQQIIHAFEQSSAPVSSVARIGESKVSRYGTAAGEATDFSGAPSYWMRAMMEKPSVEYAREHLRTPGIPDDQFLCFYGIHAFPSAAFDCLKHLIDNDIRQKGEIQMAAAQEMLFQRGPYLLAEIQGEQYDMGTPDGLILTQIALAMRSPYREPARALFESL